MELLRSTLFAFCGQQEEYAILPHKHDLSQFEQAVAADFIIEEDDCKVSAVSIGFETSPSIRASTTFTSTTTTAIAIANKIF